MLGDNQFSIISNVFFYFFVAQQDEMMATDFSLLVGLSVALTVFLIVTLTSIKILRRKGTSPSIYTMTNLSKYILHHYFWEHTKHDLRAKTRFRLSNPF